MPSCGTSSTACPSRSRTCPAVAPVLAVASSTSTARRAPSLQSRTLRNVQAYDAQQSANLDYDHRHTVSLCKYYSSKRVVSCVFRERGALSDCDKVHVQARNMEQRRVEEMEKEWRENQAKLLAKVRPRASSSDGCRSGPACCCSRSGQCAAWCSASQWRRRRDGRHRDGQIRQFNKAAWRVEREGGAGGGTGGRDEQAACKAAEAQGAVLVCIGLVTGAAHPPVSQFL